MTGYTSICQTARTVAVFVPLYKAGKLKKTMKRPYAFKSLVYDAE